MNVSEFFEELAEGNLTVKKARSGFLRMISALEEMVTDADDFDGLNDLADYGFRELIVGLNADDCFGTEGLEV